MSIIFWGLTTTMIVAAVATIAVPNGVRETASKSRTIAMAVVLSVFAIGLYSFIGSPEAVTAETGRAVSNPTSSARAPNEKRSTSVGSVASLVDGLSNRLDREPDDADGWILLARSYEYLGRHGDAAIAYGKAKALGKGDPTLDKTLAFIESSPTDAGTTAGPSLRGRVSLSREAASLVRPQDTVFIFAKSDTGQAMPLVALRKTIADLPLEYALTDDMAMTPGDSLADFDKVVVIARVSRSGRAKDVFAGLEITSEPVSPLTWNYIDLQLSSDAAPDYVGGGISE